MENTNVVFTSLLNKTVTLFWMNYFYNGVLVEVNDSCITLKSPKIIYETGAFSDTSWKDVQSMAIPKLHVQISAIESFGETK